VLSENADIVTRMQHAIVRILKENDAPKEMYARYGLQEKA